MAQPSTIYRATIQLADIDRGMYETSNITVARHPSETEERLVARLLAYALCYEEGIQFTKGVGAGEEPDLWLKDPGGRVVLWCEVGLPEAERLVKASRHSENVVLLAFGKGLPVWKNQHLEKLQLVKNLSIVFLEQRFIDQLVLTIERSINWTVTISDGNVYINVGDDTFETVVTRHHGN